MPRTLPWKNKGGSSTVVKPRPKATDSTNKPRERALIQTADSDRDSGEKTDKFEKPTKRKSPIREPSTSPPPEPPTEIYMEEGMEHDDKYRMVEDEFLSIGKKFTAHLHAAEYKRQEKTVKTRNADTINNISRPVVGKMSDSTKRKLDGIERSTKQRTILDALGAKKESDGFDSSDEESLPYVGTSLYGLMTSHKKSGVSLTKIASPTKTTRAAAGFRKPSSQMKARRPVSPSIKILSRKPQPPGNEGDNTTETEDDDDDDDLDAPVPAPSFKTVNLEHPQVTETKPMTRVSEHKPVRPIPSSKAQESVRVKIEKSPTSQAEPMNLSSSHNTEQRERIRKRLEQAKLRKRQEEEKKKHNVIPTFL